MFLPRETKVYGGRRQETAPVRPSRVMLAAGIAFATALIAPATAAGAPTAAGGVTPAVSTGQQHLTVTVRAGQRRDVELAVTNTGSAEVAWRAADGPSPARAGATPPVAGAVLRSWEPPGVAIAWGIGLASRNVWVSDIDLLRNERHSLDGVRWSEWGWPTDFVHEYPGPADMAYVPRLGLMCQVKVGEENGIHCWNPDTGLTEASITGDLPWTAVSQRGLAYRADDDTFYVGGWNQGVVYHIAGLGHPVPGAVLGRCTPADPAISGLGFSRGFNLLWMATSSTADTLYAIDPDTCRTLRTLAPPDANPSTGAGLDVDRHGDLWLVSTTYQLPSAPPHRVYQVSSGVPSFRNVPWLSVTPGSGTLAPGQTRRLTVRVDARDLAPGRSQAAIYLLAGAPNQPLITVPVRVVVLPR